MRHLLPLIWLLCLFIPVNAVAHSTAGLKKQTLKTATLTVDNVAYYLERHVGKRLDEAGRSSRYYIDDFVRIEQSGDRAKVYARVRDQKTSQLAEEVFRLRKNADDTWDHVSADGRVITAAIYHYAKENRSRAFSLGINIILAIAALAMVGRAVMDRRRK